MEDENEEDSEISFGGNEEDESVSVISDESDESISDESDGSNSDVTIPVEDEFVYHTFVPLVVEGEDGELEEGGDDSIDEREGIMDLINTTCTIKYADTAATLYNSKIVLKMTDPKTVFYIFKKHTDNILNLMDFKMDTFTARNLIIYNYNFKNH